VIVAAHDEADAIGATLESLTHALSGAAIYVADDGSTDETAAVAEEFGAEVVGRLAVSLYTSPSPRDGLLSRMPSSA
jgi:glycosyltransferase involved in cell wall biosynthesis